MTTGEKEGEREIYRVGEGKERGVRVGVRRHGSDTLRRDAAKGPTDPGEGVKILVMAARTTVSKFNDRRDSRSTL